ncbi:MAG: 3-methyladenine glycosylase/8-oxoguanine glycosylase-like protein [Actinomycetia bacterium]|nr:3-methyladenine glycosylase/8-oxoguanine glycosylase-like protein [Actinomycetes bacterium]
MGCESAERDWNVPFPLDVRLTLSVQGRGRGDPTFRADEAGAIWRTSLTPDGPATLRVTSRGQALDPPAPGQPAPGQQAPGQQALGTRVISRAWGPGATWLLDALPGCLGLHDDVSGFDPGEHPLIRDAARRNPGLRIGRSGRLMEALVPAILEQKVVILEAHRAWKILLAKYGTLPPGPAPPGMRVFPGPAVWRRIPSWDWHQAGVEGVRAQTIMRAASVADSLERLLDATHAEADRKLRSLPGIGVWTSAEARQRAAGDPDAVSVGDYHLSNIVGFALAGRDRTDDAGMLELLRPYEGHRYRVTRLIGLSAVRRPGVVPKRNAGGPPRRGPRLAVRDYRHF